MSRREELPTPMTGPGICFTALCSPGIYHVRLCVFIALSAFSILFFFPNGCGFLRKFVDERFSTYRVSQFMSKCLHVHLCLHLHLHQHTSASQSLPCDACGAHTAPGRNNLCDLPRRRCKTRPVLVRGVPEIIPQTTSFVLLERPLAACIQHTNTQLAEEHNSYIHTYIHTYIHIYIFLQRTRKGKRECIKCVYVCNMYVCMYVCCNCPCPVILYVCSYLSCHIVCLFNLILSYCMLYVCVCVCVCMCSRIRWLLPAYQWIYIKHAVRILRPMDIQHLAELAHGAQHNAPTSRRMVDYHQL